MNYTPFPARLAVLLLGASACRNPEPTPKGEPARRQQPARSASVALPIKGASGSLRETTLFVQPLSSGGRLEIRDIEVGSDSTTAFTPAQEVALEVRSGEIVAVVRGQRRTGHPGSAWLGEPGERIGIWSTGEGAVVRAIYLLPPAK